MSKRYSGKSFKDSSSMKEARLSLKEKRKIKREKKQKQKLRQKDDQNIKNRVGRSKARRP